ncbi:MAG: branched-chain amino acid ABC transporter permease [candidate division GAL15 bacterium]
MSPSVRKALPVLAAAAVLSAVPAVLGGSPYQMRIATLMLVLASYAVAFNVLFGHTNQLFLCVGALASLGGYGSVLLVRDLHVFPLAAVGVAAVLSAGVGGFLSYVSVRRGFGVLFVGIVTLAVSLMLHNLLLGLREVTNGETGIVTRGLGVGLAEDPYRAYYTLLAVLVASLWAYRWLFSSPHGVALHALSEDEVSAELSGIDVTRYKVACATASSGLVGLVGALYADLNGFISPSVYTVGHVDIPVLIALLLGGMRTLVGAVLFSAVDELVRPFGQLTVLAYGVLLVVLFLVFRQGAVPLVQGALSHRLRPAFRPAGLAGGASRAEVGGGGPEAGR